MKGKKMFGQFTSIPNLLFLDKRLPRNCVLIYGVLQSYANMFGEVRPSYETIAGETGLNRATVIRLMKRLVLYGYIVKEKGYFKKDNVETAKQGSNYYFLNPNPEKLCGKNVDKSKSYTHEGSQKDTNNELQSATPNKKRYIEKNACIACSDNIIYLPIRTRNYPKNEKSGESGNRPSVCGNNEKFLGQASTKKLTSAFDATVATEFVENYMQK